MMLCPFCLGEEFHFRGSGWKKKDQRGAKWDEGEMKWIVLMDKLMSDIFSGDYLSYMYTSTGSRVSDESLPKLHYNHAEWESEYLTRLAAVDLEAEMTYQTKWPLTPVSSRRIKR